MNGNSHRNVASLPCWLQHPIANSFNQQWIRAGLQRQLRFSAAWNMSCVGQGHGRWRGVTESMSPQVDGLRSASARRQETSTELKRIIWPCYGKNRTKIGFREEPVLHIGQHAAANEKAASIGEESIHGFVLHAHNGRAASLAGRIQTIVSAGQGSHQSGQHSIRRIRPHLVRAGFVIFCFQGG